MFVLGALIMIPFASISPKKDSLIPPSKTQNEPKVFVFESDSTIGCSKCFPEVQMSTYM